MFREAAEGARPAKMPGVRNIHRFSNQGDAQLMPAKKKLTETVSETAAPAAKRVTRTRTKKSEEPVAAAETKTAETKPAARTRKPAAPKTQTPAATHKAPARKVAVRKPVAAAAPEFDIEMHRAEIEREAYFQWINRGGGHGSDAQDWLRAVEIVKARYA